MFLCGLILGVGGVGLLETRSLSGGSEFSLVFVLVLSGSTGPY